MTPPLFPNHRFGRNPSPPDNRTLRLADYAPPDRLPTPPDKVDPTVRYRPPYSAKGNDRYGCCVFSSIANLREHWMAQNGGDKRFTDKEVIDLYLRYSPRDNGYNVLESLKKWRSDGFWSDHLWYFASVDMTNLLQVRQTIAFFGGLHTGAMIPRKWMSTTIWQMDGRGVYGHSMAAIGYDKENILVRSWPRLYLVANDAWMRYFDEGYAIVDAEQFNADGKTPEGLDLPALAAAVKRLGAL
jgi:hypothetical protein